MEKKCEMCGIVYKRQPSQFAQSRFCSMKCLGAYCGKKVSADRKKKWDNQSETEVLQIMRISFEEFFEKKENSCWIWTSHAGKQIANYATFSFRGKKIKSNRASWMIYRGEIPKGSYVLHKCDVRSCVNPDHLFLGTHRDNMHDMIRKGRSGLGRYKLTKAQMLTIREKLSLGATTTGLAKEFNVSSTCIWYIKHNRSWVDKSLITENPKCLTKLNEQKIIEIRKELNSGNLSYQKIADMFNVSKKTILNIKQGKIWKHV